MDQCSRKEGQERGGKDGGEREKGRKKEGGGKGRHGRRIRDLVP